MDRCIDDIWISDGIDILGSEVSFNEPSRDDPSLWPSYRAGLWSDLRIWVGGFKRFANASKECSDDNPASDVILFRRG